MTTERRCYHCDKPTTNELVCDACRPASAWTPEAIGIVAQALDQEFYGPGIGEMLEAVVEAMGQPPEPYMQMTRDYLEMSKRWEAAREEAAARVSKPMAAPHESAE